MANKAVNVFLATGLTAVKAGLLFRFIDIGLGGRNGDFVVTKTPMPYEYKLVTSNNSTYY